MISTVVYSGTSLTEGTRASRSDWCEASHCNTGRMDEQDKIILCSVAPKTIRFHF